MTKIILFGTGDYYKKYRKWFDKANVIALLDNNVDIQGNRLNDITIYSPNQISSFSYDYIYILSLREKEMRSQLLDLGVDPNKIKSWRNLILDHKWYADKREIVKYNYSLNRNSKTGESILLITDNLERTGGNIAELYMAKALSESGYDVTVASYTDGPLRQDILYKNIQFVIDPNLQVETLEDITDIHKYSVVILNTIYVYMMLMRKPKDIPVLWWLHEPECIYSVVSAEDLNMIDETNLWIFGVSDIARDAFYSRTRKFKIDVLPLGEPDLSRQGYTTKSYSGNQIVFGVSGVISQIKGQEILLKAIQKLSQFDLEKSVFLFAGKAKSTFGKKFIKQISLLKNENVKYIGELGEKEIPKFYNDIDVLIVPSITETLSMTAIEAMMFCKPSIVSTGAGISTFIKDKYNGYIFLNGNIDDLDNKISECIYNPQEVIRIGKNARCLYDDQFGFASFQKRVNEIVMQMINHCNSGEK